MIINLSDSEVRAILKQWIEDAHGEEAADKAEIELTTTSTDPDYVTTDVEDLRCQIYIRDYD